LCIGKRECRLGSAYHFADYAKDTYIRRKILARLLRGGIFRISFNERNHLQNTCLQMVFGGVKQQGIAGESATSYREESRSHNGSVAIHIRRGRVYLVIKAGGEILFIRRGLKHLSDQDMKK